MFLFIRAFKKLIDGFTVSPPESYKVSVPYTTSRVEGIPSASLQDLCRASFSCLYFSHLATASLSHAKIPSSWIDCGYCPNGERVCQPVFQPLSSAFLAPSNISLASLCPLSTILSICSISLWRSSGLINFLTPIAFNFLLNAPRALRMALVALFISILALLIACSRDSFVAGGIATLNCKGLWRSDCGFRESVEAEMAELMGLTC